MNIKNGVDPHGPEHTSKTQIIHILISLAVMIAIAVLLELIKIVFKFEVPNPNMILIAGLAVFTSLYGYFSGIACGVVMIIYSMYFFSVDHSIFTYNPIGLQKIAVIVFGVVLNVISIGHLKKRQTEAEMELLRDNRVLAAASTVDHLTGVKNRFGLRRDFQQYEDKDLYLMMIDIDGFKGINDNYGHAAGDLILQCFGSILREVFGSDCTYRYGGDEFLVICRNYTEEEFTDRLEDLTQGLDNIQPCNGIVLSGFSGGYVYGKAANSGELRTMIRQADSCLYEAKHTGKNKCVGKPYNKANAEAAELKN